MLRDLLLGYEHRTNRHSPREKTRYALLLQQLGLTYLSLGEGMEARGYFELALGLHRQNADPANEGVALGNIGLS